MSKETAEQFTALYGQWEHYLKARFGQQDMRKMSQKFLQEEATRCKKEGISENQLLGLVNIRNAHAHSASLLEIKHHAVVLLRKLTNAFCKKVNDIATPGPKIYAVPPQTNIKEVVLEMGSHLYTHVPIVRGRRFYGVFSENTLLKIVSSGRWNNDLKISNVMHLLKGTEGDDDYKFLPEDASFYNVYQLFQEYIDRGKRLGVVFITKNGRETGDIKGLITAWDLHKGLTP